MKTQSLHIPGRITPARRHLLVHAMALAWTGPALGRDPQRPSPRPAAVSPSESALDPAEPADPPALLLARDWPAGTHPAGYLVSEKLDGVRAHWDGRQLRTRSGRPILAPAAWLGQLPGEPLDGELWIGRGQFEAVSALARRQDGQDDLPAWQRVQYQVFEAPGRPGGFGERMAALARAADADAGRPAAERNWQILVQRPVPDARALLAWLRDVEAAGGEGLVLHRENAPYVTGRAADVLFKFKSWQDAEAQVLALVPGKGRLAGMTGALEVRSAEGRVFRIGAGLADERRRHPPAVGSWISYRHRGVTATGLPRFATFWREAPPG